MAHFVVICAIFGAKKQFEGMKKAIEKASKGIFYRYFITCCRYVFFALFSDKISKLLFSDLCYFHLVWLILQRCQQR